MAMREFRVWGAVPAGVEDGRVRVEDGESVIDRVIARIERDSGLQKCGGPKSEGTALQNGEPEAHHYSVTLGRPVRGGGWAPEGQIWIAIPIAS